MKKQESKEKLKESFSIFQKPKVEEEATAKKDSNGGVGEAKKEESAPKKPAKKLEALFSGEETKGYSAVQVKRFYLEKIDELAKEHKTTKTRVVNIIIEEFLKEHGII